jgi:pyrophosphatase PpaX
MEIFIFDLDGTLVHSYPLVMHSFKETFKKFDVAYDEREVIARYSSDEEGILSSFIPREKMKVAFDHFLYIFKRDHDLLCPTMIEGIPQLLQEAKDRGIDMYLVSGRSRGTLGISSQFFNLDRYFLEEFHGEIDGMKKVENIKKVIEKSGSPLSRIIYIGDSVNDIKAAEECGVKIISANYDISPRTINLSPYNPQGTVHSVEELKSVLFINEK